MKPLSPLLPRTPSSFLSSSLPCPQTVTHVVVSGDFLFFLWKWNLRVRALFCLSGFLLCDFSAFHVSTDTIFLLLTSIHGTDTPNSFTDSLAHAHVGFHFLDFIKKATMIFECKFLCGHGFHVSWVDKGNGEIVTVASYIFAFLRHCQSGFQCGGFGLRSHQQRVNCGSSASSSAFDGVSLVLFSFNFCKHRIPRFAVYKSVGCSVSFNFCKHRIPLLRCTSQWVAVCLQGAQLSPCLITLRRTLSC